MSELPPKALSIMQPWAWLIVNGFKHIENRDWPTKFRGPVAVHAGKKLDKDAISDLWNCRHPATGEQSERTAGLLTPDMAPGGEWQLGGIVGVAEIVDCVSKSDDPWFVGRYGFVIANARPIPFIPLKGALGFFRWRDRL